MGVDIVRVVNQMKFLNFLNNGGQMTSAAWKNYVELVCSNTVLLLL